MAKKAKAGISLLDVQQRIIKTEEALGKVKNVSPENLVGRVGDLFDRVATGEVNTQEYGDLAVTVALLLDEAGVHDISTAAANSVSARWSAQVHPLASLLNRVHTVFLLHVEERDDLYKEALQKLWAALELRCETVTAVSFEKAIEDGLEAVGA